MEACEGDGGIALAAPRLDLVPIEALLAHVDKKAPVDLLGVVTAVQPLGSVKRKADDSTVARRDVTLVGRGCVILGWGWLILGWGRVVRVLNMHVLNIHSEYSCYNSIGAVLDICMF